MFRKFLSSMMMLVLLGGFSSISEADMLINKFDHFAQIPVLDQGRIKPLDTYARSQLEIFYGRDKLPNLTASEWLAELLFSPKHAYKREVFNVVNPQVIDALELQRKKKHRYSYVEISDAFSKHFDLLHPILVKPEEDLTLEQRQLLVLFVNVNTYVELSKTFSMLFPIFEITSEKLAKDLDVNIGEWLNFIQIQEKQPVLQNVVRDLLLKVQAKDESMKSDDMILTSLIGSINQVAQDKTNVRLKIITPTNPTKESLWHAPWEVTTQEFVSQENDQLLNLWSELLVAYREENNTEWNELSKNINEYSLSSANNILSVSKLTLEGTFNKVKLFTKSLMFYLIAFLFMLASFIMYPVTLRKSASIMIMVAFGFHLMGIIIRMIIMGRPPVTTLYESILFVGLIVVLFGIILENVKKNGIGLIVGSTAGIILQFLAMRYDADGDSMGMLIAVLNTNFWLSTHVVTITIGYGCCLVAGIIGHVYLLSCIFKPKEKGKQNELLKSLQGVGLVALFFALFGTILGGIWADQSWGRFWGWDPKENGALLIVLWLAWLIHGKIAGQIKALGFAVGMTCLNIIVALAWFGVNLLSVGLHSYGFTQSAVFNLFAFCGAECVFALTCLGVLKYRQNLLLK